MALLILPYAAHPVAWPELREVGGSRRPAPCGANRFSAEMQAGDRLVALVPVLPNLQRGAATEPA